MMTTKNLLAAKRRSRRRALQGGAIIFIVAMTLAVLASLGLYALQSASMEVKTSGYGRQNAQSHYLSEYGTLTGANAMGGTTGQLYLAMMKNPTQRDTACVSLSGVDVNASDLSKSCRRMGSSELSSAWGTAVPAVAAPTTAVAGSLGPYALTGDFYVEVTDPSTGAAMWGIDTKLGLCFQQFTLTAVGITQPDQTLLGAPLAPTALYGAEGLEMSRARITSGPMRQGCN
jgi:cytosine/uracil/thiamine/allantoin permease